jgi:hypothetical protein
MMDMSLSLKKYKNVKSSMRTAHSLLNMAKKLTLVACWVFNLHGIMGMFISVFSKGLLKLGE